MFDSSLGHDRAKVALPLLDANSSNPLEASIARLREEEAQYRRECVANASVSDAATLAPPPRIVIR